jgi:predicted site-specific integrase-resolvase
MKNEKLFTPSAIAREAAELGLARSERWFSLAGASGKIPCITTTTGRRLFRRSDVQKFIAERRQTRVQRSGE